MKRISQASKNETSRTEYPKIRPGIQPFRYQDKNKKEYIGLKDSLELSDALLLLPQDLFYLLQFFDGIHSTDDILSAYMRQFGNLLPPARLNKMIKKMDDGLLLDNRRSNKRIQQLESAFRKLDVRPPACAGSSYAAEKIALLSELDEYSKQGVIEKANVDAFSNSHVKAMVLPHIDPRLGGAAYGAGYNALRFAGPVDLFIILGISHQATKNSFVLTTKDFQTPLGLVKSNKTLVENVLNNCTTDFSQDELVHRDEHSIEFQTVFLKYNQKTDFQIVPILCSFSHQQSDSEKSQFAEFTSALRRELRSYSGSVCFIASVDFSHIGPQYGDYSPSSYELAKVEQSDKAVIAALANHDLEQFAQCFERTNNMYNICGYPALYTLLDVLPKSTTTLLKYDNAIMDEQRSTVTFATMIFS